MMLKDKIIGLLILFSSLIQTGCKQKTEPSNSTTNQQYVSSNSERNTEYPDGTYCAEVDYYYSATGTNSTYTLSVEVEDGKLVRIDWPNGGWLDETHFDSPDIEDGTAEFTSDKGVDYTVRILGQDGSCQLSSNAVDEDQLVEQQQNEYQEKMDTQDENDRLQREEDERNNEEEQHNQKEEENPSQF